MSNGTILVIDDDETVRDSIISYLDFCGFTTLAAGNGLEGLTVVEQQQPDLILCDLRMPQMDGLTMLSHVRGQPNDVPFIVVSGAGVMSDVVEALHLGASDYLIKPITDLEVLEYAINRALEKARLVIENRNYRESLEEANNSLQNSVKLLEEDQKAGRQVQMNILPKHPLALDGFSVSHHISPSLYLSGDFVDYFRLNDHSFAFYLADVSGHGASSAFVTVLLKHMSISLLQEYHRDGGQSRIKPSYVLTHINRSLLKNGLGKHVTIFGGVVDMQANTLTYAFGGHYPLPILSANGQVNFIEGRGFPVGLFDEVTFEDITIDLPEQFHLTVFSDGILEVLPQPTLKEKEAYLLSVIKAEGLESSAQGIQSLYEALALNTVKDAPDDIAMLVLTRNKL